MRSIFTALTLLLLVLSIGCITVSDSQKQETKDTQYQIHIVDDHGTAITFKKPPERIISLAPSNTEILYALGLADRIVGVTSYDDYPPEASEKEKIGGFKDVNIEKVVSLEPDVVFATGGIQAETVEKLREVGLTVVIMDAKTVEDVFKNILLVGQITGKDEESELFVNGLEERVEKVKQRAQEIKQRPRVAYLLWGDPLMVAGSGTFIEDLIVVAGGENIYSDSAIEYPKVSIESMIERDPEVLIKGDHSDIDSAKLKDNPAWADISAVKNSRFHTIDGNIVNRQGPRVVDGLELFSLWIVGEG